jgi:hypothetical protein
MNRREFLGEAIGMAATAALVRNANAIAAPEVHPCAITMWEFSWIERRWPGAGYEDWDHASMN